MLLRGDAEGSGRGYLEELRLMIVLLRRGMYCMLALLWILIFDFYMILCSYQIMKLNNCLVVRLSFDRRASIPHKWELSKC